MKKMRIDRAALCAVWGRGVAIAEKGATRYEAFLRRFYGALWRRLRSPADVVVAKGRIIIADAPRVGGRVVTLNLMGSEAAYTATLNECTVEIRAPGEARPALVLLEYADPQTAHQVFNKVRAALLPTPMTTWALRVTAVLVGILFFNAVARVVFGPAGPADATAAMVEPTGVAAALADPSFVPAEQEATTLPLVDASGNDLAAAAAAEVNRLAGGVDITQDTPEARQALARLEAQLAKGVAPATTPPIAGADAMPGLKGFGLKGGPGDGGPACDPALAYQVD